MIKPFARSLPHQHNMQIYVFGFHEERQELSVLILQVYLQSSKCNCNFYHFLMSPIKAWWCSALETFFTSETFCTTLQ